MICMLNSFSMYYMNKIIVLRIFTLHCAVNKTKFIKVKKKKKKKNYQKKKKKKKKKKS